MKRPGEGVDSCEAEASVQSRRKFVKTVGAAGFGLFAWSFVKGSPLRELYGPSPYAKERFLTKDGFGMGAVCPTKLYYLDKPEYTNKTLTDPFMEALGEGGFQVAELAKFYHPEGISFDKTLEPAEAVEKTRQVINRSQRATLFDSTFVFGNLIVQPDILIVEADRIRIIEVKAKVSDSANPNQFRTKKGRIRSGWRSHIYDISFQKYVLQKALPRFKVSAYLMMADKSKTCPTEKLNQKFKIVKGRDGQKSIARSPGLSNDDRRIEILTKINVDEYCDQVFREDHFVRGKKYDFEGMVGLFETHLRQDKKIKPEPLSICRDCEFKGSKDTSVKDGFKECWSESLKWNDADFAEPNILKLWSYRKKDGLIKAGRIKQKDVKKGDIKPKTDKKAGLSRTERQWLQITKIKENDSSAYVDTANLKREMESWVYPLHFIDFETSAPAIPFVKGMRPYEGIAFQYSHHVVHKDGRIEHRGEWLNAEPGEFPSFNFIRALKKELETDNGSIFRYSSHENTYLNFIYRQLKASETAIPDSVALRTFIKSITKSTGGSSEKWIGARNMIDQWELVKRFYYNPLTNGSNSIKSVLPAILESSAFLQQKYSKPVYGSAEIPSLNFKDWIWLKRENGKVVDPYKQLPKMFQDFSENDATLLSTDNTLGDGGAALTAYGRLQFEEMSDYERSELKKALLKYCELDTFAMVLIYEGWKDLVENK